MPSATTITDLSLFGECSDRARSNDAIELIGSGDIIELFVLSSAGGEEDDEGDEAEGRGWRGEEGRGGRRKGELGRIRRVRRVRRRDIVKRVDFGREE